MTSVNIFHNPSVSSTVGSRTTESIDGEASRAFLILDDVKISPGYMHFNDAYEGKEFKQKLVIQNCGSRSAFVRLGGPNSMGFEFKSFPEGQYLSPGLKIVRTVTHIYRSVIGVKRGFATIHVNEKKVDYRFFVTLSGAVLSLEPQQLHFGRIDAVNVATTRTLYIKNSGSKGTQFAIDLGRNELELIVEPMKGTVPAKSSVPLRVELVGSAEGEFTEEFWVKASPPLRAIVTGIFIAPRLLVRKFIPGLDFTMVEFGPTYYGSHATKPLLIKNSSPSHSMFCVMGEVKGSPVFLEEARLLDESFANFRIKPTDGRMAADKGSVVQITFAPVKNRSVNDYAACFLKVTRLDCRDVDPHELEVPQRNNEDTRSRETTLSSMSSLSSDRLFTDDNNSQQVSSISVVDAGISLIAFQQAIGICLYGVKMEAVVVLRPNFIVLNDLTISESHERELYIENKCLTLPIRVKYCKVASVDVVPSEVDLEPGESVEVKIVIKTSHLGNVCKKIFFDLLAFDYPPQTGVVRKVGSANLKLCIVVKNVVGKPRLDQCLLCYDQPLKYRLTPDYPFRKTSLEVADEVNNENYYLKYINNRRERRLAAAVSSAACDYDLTNQKHLLCQDFKCQNPPPRCKAVTSYTPFIPLTPKQLYNIWISPKSIKLKKVAPFTVITDHFHIENRNPFPIRISLKASKSCIFFSSDARYVIGSDSPIGTRILALIFNSETHHLRHAIDKPVEYKVVVAKDCPFVTVQSVVIDDVNSEKYFELPVHPVANLKEAKCTVVRLVTEVEQEKRFYKFHFKSSQKRNSQFSYV